MAKFFFKRNRRIFITDTGGVRILPDANGLPIAVTMQPKSFIVEGGYLESEDPDIIARIRKDPQFNTEEIREITAADERVLNIRKKHMEEAQKEIEALDK